MTYVGHSRQVHFNDLTKDEIKFIRDHKLHAIFFAWGQDGTLYVIDGPDAALRKRVSISVTLFSDTPIEPFQQAFGREGH